MATRPKGAATAVADPINTASATKAQNIELPAQNPPTATDFPANIKALIALSDKDARMFYCGLYQAVLQSSPTFSTGVVKDLKHWHELVDAEVEYFARRILEKARELK